MLSGKRGTESDLSDPDEPKVGDIKLPDLLIALAWGFGPGAVVIGEVKILQAIFPQTSAVLLLVSAAVPVCVVLYAIGLWRRRRHATRS
jgi:hypothetical protein